VTFVSSAGAPGTALEIPKLEVGDMSTPDPRSIPNRPGGDVPDQDALAVDALPDETRMRGDSSETELNQTTRGGPEPDTSDDEADEGP
jgi:hypothetical protein